MITEYPLHIDIFALIIFLGTVQGIFLSYFFLNKENRKVKANIFLGLLLITSSLLSFDILISYTNFMFQVIYLVDATEPLNLLIGPLFFLYLNSKVNEKKIIKVYFHFIPASVYFIYALLFQMKSSEVKYNAYINQYHPELDFVNAIGFSDPLFFKHFINELTIISILVYLIVSIILLLKTKSINSTNKEYKILWIDIVFMSLILLTLIFVKIYFEHDLGDYIIIVALCIFIYSISFKIIRNSDFFSSSKIDKKYSNSALDEDTKLKILDKIENIMDGRYYIINSPSLPDLSKKINSTPNYVSQVINEKLGLTFHDLINTHRIEEAKKMILDPELNETIEGIAYLVGFNSKSTFHSAFKKFTGLTPSQFKETKK